MPTPDLDKFAGRSFSFYPAIRNVEHNEWDFLEATWSEVKVRNTGDRQELWIPRRYVGEISQVDDPVMIVGLNQELSFQGGLVRPYHRRVVEMPAATNVAPMPVSESTPPPSKLSKRASGSESAAEKSVTKLIVGVLVFAVVGTFLTVWLTRDRNTGGRINYETVLQAELGLSGQDDYFAVVRKLGEPSNDRWRADEGEQQFRALDYPDLGITVLLMGADRERVLYIGAKDENWRNVHSVKLPGGVNTDSILRSLQSF